MRLSNRWLLPFLIVLIPGIVFSCLLPYFPVDETRYLSVAWEMKLHNSFIVPLQNALPYAHKPPFLFWLFNLDWLLFGVNEATLRLVPLLFSLLNITLTYRIALLLWEEERIARYAALILSSTLSYLLWSSFIMFDVVVTFWVLLALFGLLSAAREHSARSWLLVGLSIGGGILTKGPVVFVYILPAALLPFLWIPRERCSRGWYGWLALSALIGIAVVLVWLVPAALTGGQAYREAILWKQTVNRVANSFAHRRPFWWYLPWLPALLFPWILLKPLWRGAPGFTSDLGNRFLLICATATVAIFSMISGKQVHYLIPVLPVFSLLMARRLASSAEAEGRASGRLAVPAFYGALGGIALALSFSRLGKAMATVGISEARALAIGLVLLALAMLVTRQRSVSGLVRCTALSSAVFCILLVVSGDPFFGRYNLHGISNAIRAKQEEGYSVIHLGKYHGQYQFLGRLKEPLVTLESREKVAEYAASHEKVALITYEPRAETIPEEEIYFRQPFRSKQVVLWNRKGILDFSKPGEGATSQPAPVKGGGDDQAED